MLLSLGPWCRRLLQLFLWVPTWFALWQLTFAAEFAEYACTFTVKETEAHRG